jgi:hypothetical protein
MVTYYLSGYDMKIGPHPHSKVPYSFTKLFTNCFVLIFVFIFQFKIFGENWSVIFL